ncbi:MAG: hypothetical protein GY855_07795 [candidate division Zixibacteria bacterium]|nr:hypothetical protein [candidate division Zixibacteria bacterium]
MKLEKLKDLRGRISKSAKVFMLTISLLTIAFIVLPKMGIGVIPVEDMIVTVLLDDDSSWPCNHNSERYIRGEYAKIGKGDTLYCPQGHPHIVMERTIIN